MTICRQSLQVVQHALWLFFKRLVRRIAHAVQRFLWVSVKRREEAVEIFLRRTFGCDELECLAQGLI